MDAPKKRSKRYGTLVQSPARGLNDMLIHHKRGVQDFILQKVAQGGVGEAE